MAYGSYMDMIEILPLKYEHCEQVYEIARLSLPEHWSLEGIRDVLNYDNNIYYVSVEKDDDISADKVIGFGGIMIVADEAELLNIAVAESARGRGIATDILSRLITDVEEADCVRLLLEVRSNNIAAFSLYEKLGFEKLGIRKNYYSNPIDDAIIMARELKMS